MSYNLKRGETVSLNALARELTGNPWEARKPVETTRDAIKRNDLDALHLAIKVFGIK